jgi:VanW like protein/Glycosyl transferases group 1
MVQRDNWDVQKRSSLSKILIFQAKVTLLQLRRSGTRFWRSPQKYPKSLVSDHSSIIATSITPLRQTQDDVENALTAGKIQNLRVAVRKINGITIPKDGVFSFWTQVGRPTRSEGYIMGRELRQGCLIPSIGGGLCQLSNALYNVALDAGLEILERHAHTQVIPGSLAEIGRDATVFWNYVDLRFKAHEALTLEAFLTSTTLVVQLKGRARTPLAASVLSEIFDIRSSSTAARACDACDATNCIRYSPPVAEPKSLGRTAYLVDEFWPEFDRYLQTHQSAGDLFALPLRGDRWRKSNYAWTTAGFQKVRTATGMTLGRSLASRRLTAQGKSRQEKLLGYDRALALHYAQWLTYDINHVVVMQHLLPFLWQEGYLGGRTFDVLMTRLPMLALQDHLNQAHRNYPDSTTLNDFRADADLVEAENLALKAARRLITPHREIARHFAEKTLLLDWVLPKATSPTSSLERTILFAASTLGRKGAYELRAVAKAHNLSLKLLGADLEGDRFWDGVAVMQTSGDPLHGVGLVVLPAYVEHCPRLLLQAVALGIPVIASAACGLEEVAGVVTIPTGDVEALALAIKTFY